jgi:LysR family transcriptional regulator, benzoate and cis,cis-muconate-responsive activator of ben and cat genes
MISRPFPGRELPLQHKARTYGNFLIPLRNGPDKMQRNRRSWNVPKMELRHVRYFVALADTLNFTKAAEKLGIAQPSLTRQIQDLEREFGFDLFDRSKKQVTLTPEGEFFLSGAKRLVNLASEVSASIRDLKKQSARGAISISYVAKPFHPLLQTSLARFEKEFPHISINLFGISPLDPLRSLKEGSIDIAFAGLLQPDEAPKFNVRVIDSRPVMALLPLDHPMSNRSLVGVRDFKSTSFIVLAEDRCPGYRSWLQKTCQDAGFLPKVGHVAENETAAIQAVESALGVALLAYDVDRAPRETVAFRKVDPPISLRHSVAWKKKNQSRALKAFLGILEDSIPL